LGLAFSQQLLHDSGIDPTPVDQPLCVSETDRAKAKALVESHTRLIKRIFFHSVHEENSHQAAHFSGFGGL
jgi:hypothetical protein